MNQSKNEKRERPPTKWTYLQYKKGINKSNVPIDCFLHSATRIGSKILYYGGVNIYGEPLNQLFLYDTTRLSWIPPTEPFLHQEGFPGARYGHSSTLIAMHPPKVLIWGGSTNGGTFEFDIPDSVDNEGSHPTITANPFMSVRRQGRKNKFIEETDENIYFLELNDSTWLWSKPTLTSKQSPKPLPRNEHSMCKIGANEVLMFGGWTSKPMNDVWIFNFTDLTWAQQACSGIQPRPRYRHTAEVLGTSMFILGGSDTVTDESDGCSYLSIHELNIETMQWSHPILSGVNPFPRSGHGSAVVGASIIAIFGGKRNDEIYLNDLILIDTSSYICTQIDVVSSTIPSPITNSTLTAVGNKCYVFGGIDMDGSCYEGLREIDIGYHLNSSDISVAEGLASDYSFKILVIGNACNYCIELFCCMCCSLASMHIFVIIFVYTFVFIFVFIILFLYIFIAVGKSAILSRFSEDVYTHNQHASTIGIDFTSKMIRVDRAICKLEIWDTAGEYTYL